MAGRIPIVQYGIHADSRPLVAVSYPGSIMLDGNLTHGGLPLRVQVSLIFQSSSMVVVRISVQNHGSAPALVRFRVSFSDINMTAWTGNSVIFTLPEAEFPCFRGAAFSRGNFTFSTTYLDDGVQQDLTWNQANSTELAVESSEVSIQAFGNASAFVSVVFPYNSTRTGTDARKLDSMIDNSVGRWKAYLASVLVPQVHNQGMGWVAVKSVMTLMNNWRSVPGLPDGVLPSYNGYESGFWSWDTYKQAVGMVSFAPQIAKDQLRLIVSARNRRNGHIPDKVDRCGNAGGCNGKPPLLAWAVWQIYQATHDVPFLQEMYGIAKQFHEFWYSARDVKGVGLCSWTQGMESGMDDGVRFLPEYASSAYNASSRAP